MADTTLSTIVNRVQEGATKSSYAKPKSVILTWKLLELGTSASKMFRAARSRCLLAFWVWGTTHFELSELGDFTQDTSLLQFTGYRTPPPHTPLLLTA